MQVEKDVEEMRKEWDVEMGEQLQRNKSLKRKLTEHSSKLKVLTGDIGITDFEGELSRSK